MAEETSTECKAGRGHSMMPKKRDDATIACAERLLPSSRTTARNYAFVPDALAGCIVVNSVKKRHGPAWGTRVNVRS